MGRMIPHQGTSIAFWFLVWFLAAPAREASLLDRNNIRG
jgi:hypothetical protein